MLFVSHQIPFYQNKGLILKILKFKSKSLMQLYSLLVHNQENWISGAFQTSTIRKDS